LDLSSPENKAKNQNRSAPHFYSETEKIEQLKTSICLKNVLFRLSA
jgi:hypothetical protein